MISKKKTNTLVKICGIKQVEDARSAFEHGADFAGVIVDIEESPRSVSPRQAKAIVDASRLPVVVLIDRPIDTTSHITRWINPYAIQIVGEFHPDEIERIRTEYTCRLWKTVHIPVHSEADGSEQIQQQIRQYRQAGIDTVVLDTMVKGKKGGTGRVCDWETARAVVQNAEANIFLAGGLTPSNICHALSSVGPQGIDVSSGVEIEPGIKDPGKIARLIAEIRQFDKKHSMIQEV